jgi:UDP-N-acetylmuramoyl-tripeptide--D-alanyl-D-alanine ligase
MSALWTSAELVAAMDGRPVGALPESVPGISIDTRSMAPGDAFFAIKGDRFDGHDFATAAMAAGAGLMVVSEARLPSLGRLAVPMIVVDDVLAALGKAGVAARARSKAKIIAVTGSAGKTTTKEALRVALSTVGKVHASDKSFNNHWGVPLTLARLPADADYAVFEIGMNHAGEIRPLVGMVRPHVAIVTLIAAAHLGNFRNLDEIALAKAEIFEGIERDGHALINRDDQRFKLLDKEARKAGVDHVWSFGEHSRANIRLMHYEPSNEGVRTTVRIAGEEHAFRIGAPGRHIAQNVLAVLGAAYLAGADMPRVIGAMAGLEAEKGRGRRHRLAAGSGGEIVLIDESYNANPASMKAALDMLGAAEPGEGGRRVAVLGDMLELGEHAPKLHAGLAPALVEAGVDIALLAGPEMAALAAKLPDDMKVEHRDSVEALLPLVLDTVRGGDVVMVKSSNGTGSARVVEALIKTHPQAAAGGGAAAA